MSEDGISPTVKSFIAGYISSIVELEILLLLAGRPQEVWTAEAVSRELRIDRAWAAAHLATLCAQGVAGCGQGPDPVYRFAPQRPEIRDAVDELARAYADRRVTVIGLIFSKPVDKIRTFADAFRLRKDKDKPDA